MTERRRSKILVVHNEPTVETPDGRRYLYELDLEQKFGFQNGEIGPGIIADLSEIGVIEEREDVCNALEEVGYSTSIFNIDENVERLLFALREEKPMLVFNLCESLGDKSIHEMHICSLYELMGVPYTGSDPFTLGLCLNKARVKEILSYYGIPTPRSVLIRKLPLENGEHHLDFPLIVKPSFEDASLGIDNKSVVYSWNELEQRVKFVLEEFNQPCLVEEYIEGREINVAILGNAEPAALPLSEIDFSSLPEGYPHIVSYNSKWIKGSIEFDCTIPVCPAPLEKITEKKVKEFALRAYKILGLRDYARVDIRLDRNGKPFVIEVNPNPDLSDDAGFARSGSVAGMDYHTLVQKIVEIALERNNK